MMRKILVACDPGKLSGFVVLDYTDFDDKGPEILMAQELEQQETGEQLEKWLSGEDKVNLVMEDFIITTETGKKKDTRYSLELIGVGRYFASKHSRPFALQTPARAKSFVDNDRIRDLDLWVPGGEGHHKDAMRHAILYLVDKMRWNPSGLV